MRDFSSVSRLFLLIIGLSVIILTTAVITEAAQNGKSGQKPVASAPLHMVMFWMQECRHCERILKDVLPPLKTKYGDRLKVRLIEVADHTDEKALAEIAATYKLAEEDTGVPFLMIGTQIFVGDRPIERELPALLEKYAVTGVTFPANPILKTYLNTPKTASSKDKSHKNDSMVAGLVIAAILSICMLAALAGTAWFWLRAGQLKSVPFQDSQWPDKIIPVLCLAGLLVAGYLTKVEFAGNVPFCGPVHGCDKVQSSQYAWIIKDLLPVGLLGIIGYVGMLAVWFWGRHREHVYAAAMPTLLFVMTYTGVLYALYLTYIELFVLKAACIWCLTNALLITLVLIVSTPAAMKERIRSITH